MNRYAALLSLRPDCGLKATLTFWRSNLRTSPDAASVLAFRGIHHSAGMTAKLAAQTTVKAIALTNIAFLLCGTVKDHPLTFFEDHWRR